MKTKIYTFLVNTQPGISYRYHKIHDGSTGLVKLLSWIYLLWLNFAFYIFFQRWIGKKPEIEIYENKNIPAEKSESNAFYVENGKLSVDAFVERLKGYDVISFDIFDTLIFRPFGLPTDLFFILGERLGIMNFRDIRVGCEYKARLKRNKKFKDMEINLSDIWKEVSERVGKSMADGMKLEMELEEQFCYANPFMLEVWKRLVEVGKDIIIISDMYLPKDCIERILTKAGYSGYKSIYISNEYHKSKADGKLYEVAKNDMAQSKGNSFTMIHVGDSVHSDVKMASKAGLKTLHYPSVNTYTKLYRPFDMSAIVGGAYRGIINNHIYNCLDQYSMEYEYGYIYGGLFAIGYSHFIHEYAKLHEIDRILFLSRDGDILKQVYDYMYPNEDTAYVYWSRKAATKLMAPYDKHDYIRRFVEHKVNQKYSVSAIFESMEVIFEDEKLAKAGIALEDLLSSANAEKIIKFINKNWSDVENAYTDQNDAAKAYYEEVLAGANSALAVDIGWAGSGAMALTYLAERVWNIHCKITGVIAGTNTVHNYEQDASEAFLQSGKLVSYMYSQAHNRDLLKKHDPAKNFNVYWELLLSSPTQQFKGFYSGENGEKYNLRFGDYDSNLNGIWDIQRGIIDFASDYKAHFDGLEYMFNISGRDAYAPMLVAASKKEKYLKSIEKRFKLIINVE